nr:hypothetical protein BaRGS_024544 [Batillaria attramentaria]
MQPFWVADGPGGKCYGFQSVLEDGDRRPVGIVYDASSARGNPALSGFISSPEGFEDDPKRRQAAIIDLLEDIVGPGVRNFVDFTQRDWSRIASLAFFLLTSDKVPKSRIANNIRLVFEQIKSD